MNQDNTILRDYNHAAKVFGTKTKTIAGIGTDFKNYRLSPKYGFLFYVEFDFNPMISNVSNNSAQEMGMVVKSVSLPKFTIDTKVHNAYNRKNIVQNSIKYDPINIVFHDDQADNVRNFWYDYYSFFYRDSDYADASYNIIHKYQERPSFEWGYSPRPTSGYNSAVAYQDYQYIQAIRIYSLYQQHFDEYELINPVITSFKHGEHVNGQNELLEHQMGIQFETVKYQTGLVTENTAGGFIRLNYDTTPSPNNYPTGNTPGYKTNNDTIVDLASQNLNTAGGQVVPQPNASALSPAFAFGTTAGLVTALSSAAGTNAGGFALPALGSLTSGISGSAILGQQLRAATVSLAGSAANTLAGGVVSGIARGLGPQGTQIVGLAAQAIANPTAALATVENMAIKFAMGAVNQGINSLASKVGNEIAGGISGGLSSLNTSLGTQFFGTGTFTNGLSVSASSAFGEAQASIAAQFNGSAGYSTTAFQNFQSNPVEISAGNFGNSLEDI